MQACYASKDYSRVLYFKHENIRERLREKLIQDQRNFGLHSIGNFCLLDFCLSLRFLLYHSITY